MKKYLLTALMAILVVSLVITGMLPAFAEDAIPSESELQVAAVNATVDVNAIGADFTGMTIGTNTTGASVTAGYVVPNNPGDMTVLSTGTKYTAETLPEGAIGITSAEDWAAICSAAPVEGQTLRDTNVYVLLADIEVAATVGSSAVRFAGTLYGNGYTVTTSVPLFGYVQMAKIYDLTIAGEVTGAAALIVEAFGATIVNVKNTANVTHDGSIAAGLVAQQASGAPLNGVTTMLAGGPLVIDRCVNTGAITGYSACGIANYRALNNATITITNTYNTGKIYATAYPAAGISGVLRCESTAANENGNIVIRNVKNEGEVSSNNTQINAGIVAHISNGVADQTRATIAIFENVVNTGKVWDNGKAGNAAGILGQASAGSTSASSETYYGGDTKANVTVKMTNVLNAGHVQARWAAGFLSRGANTATYLTNCTNTGTIAWSGSNNGAIGGFFSNIANAGWEQTIVMKDCVNTADITGYRGAGIFALQNIKGTVYMTDVRNEGDIDGMGNWAGGFVHTLPAAHSKAVLVNCQNDGAVQCTSNRAAGFYGIQQNGVLSFDKCLNTGTIGANKASLYVGGYIGSLQTKTGSRVDFTNCINEGTIYAKTDSYAGGFYGYSGEQTYAADAPQIFDNCENKGHVEARWAGGFAGATSATTNAKFTDCTNSGEVVSLGAAGGTGAGGGFVANVQQGEAKVVYTYENCLNSGAVSGDRVGGLWGINSNPSHTGCNNKGNTDIVYITNSANTGAITTPGYYAAGAGATVHGEVNVDGWLNTADITNTYASRSYGYAAGMIAEWCYAFGTVQNAMNTGAMTAPMMLGRGVIANNADGSNSYDINNNGDAVFGPTAAGLVAEIYGWSTNVVITGINTGAIAGQNAGGILGVATRYTQIQLNECVNFGSVTSTAASIPDDPETVDDPETEAVENNEEVLLQFIGVGGIVGVANNQYAGTGLRVNGCVNAGAVSADNYAAGGIVGASLANTSNTKIRGCVSLGNVTCVNGVAAGIIAVSENTELTHEVFYPTLDAEGNPVQEPKLDENGDAVLDEEGNPVMTPVGETRVEVYKGGVTVENCLVACEISGVTAAATFAQNVDLQGEILDQNNVFIGEFAEGTEGVFTVAEGVNNYTAQNLPADQAAAVAALGEGWVVLKCCDAADDTAMPALAAQVVFDNLYEANHDYTDVTYDAEGHMAACHCGAVEEGAEKVAHTMGDWTVVDGTHSATCTGCEYTVSGECDYEAVTTEPTCGVAGKTVYTCTVCGDSYEEEIPATGEHNYEAVTTEPTCAVAGKTVYTCSVCGDSYEEAIPATGEHNYVDGKCDVCGADDPNYVPPVEEPEVAPGEIVNVNGTLYYRENGVNVSKGLFLYTDGRYYYAKNGGALAVNTTLQASKTSCDLPAGTSYRFDENGAAATGIFTSSGKLRYYENGKSVAKGFFKHTDGNYYFAKNEGWLVVDAIYLPETTNCDLPAGVKYRFGTDGAILQGFHLYPADGTTRYYVNGKTFKAGLMKHTDGYYYYVKHSGILCTNMTVYATFSTCELPININYKFDEQGRAYEGIYTVNGKLRYYQHGKGTNAGLIEIDGDFSFAVGTGWLKTDCSYYVNKFAQDIQTKAGTYYFGKDGKAYQGVNQNANGETVYFVNGLGTNVGIYEYEGNFYMTQVNGKLRPNVVNKQNAVKGSVCVLPGDAFYDTDANGMITNIYVDGVATPIADYLATLG